MKQLPSAAKAANHLACLIAALKALRHPKALPAARRGGAIFQNGDMGLPTLPQRTREGWGNRGTTFYGAHFIIQCGVAQPWHA
jgi:hypothetical protein